MGWRELFGLKARGTAAAPAANPVAPPAQIPVPTPDWPLIVDAEGNQITRHAAPGDFLARRPVSYRFKGTIPAYDPNHWNRNERPAAALEHHMRGERNSELLERAVFLLSQTDDGRRLLQLAHQKEFSFVFDHERMKNEGAAGMCDYSNKLIPLAEGRTAAQVMLTVKHELQHMEDIERGLYSSPQDTLRSRTIVDRTLEGNARVSEAIAATQLYLGSGSGPPNQFRSGVAMACFGQKNPHMAARTHAAIDQLHRDGSWQDFVAKIFPGYYENERTLAYYDKRQIDYLQEQIPDIRADRDFISRAEPYQEHTRLYIEANARIKKARRDLSPLLVDDGNWSREKLSGVALIMGLPYLDRGDFDPASEKASFLTRETAEGLQSLTERIAAIDETKISGVAMVLASDVPAPPPPANAYAAMLPQAPDSVPQDFKPVQWPHRVDGRIMTNGQPVNEFFTNHFASKMGKIGTAISNDVERVHQVLLEEMHRDGFGSNAVVRHLEAGLLAPVAAFPDEYLAELGTVLKAGERQTIRLQPHEKNLIRHWQSMAECGIDPVWGNTPPRDHGYYRHDRHNSLHQWILGIVAPPKTSGGPVAHAQPAAALT